MENKSSTDVPKHISFTCRHSETWGKSLQEKIPLPFKRSSQQFPQTPYFSEESAAQNILMKEIPNIKEAFNHPSQ